MRHKTFDQHPLVQSFRLEAQNLPNNADAYYHFLLPPEYDLREENPKYFQYLFVEYKNQIDILFQYNNPSISFEKRSNFLIPLTGINHNIRIEILQSTSCTTTTGISFDMHEIETNPFVPSPIPPLCAEIKATFTNPEKSIEFLKTRVRSHKLPDIMNRLSQESYAVKFTVENIDNIIKLISHFSDEICETIFEVKPFHFIPSINKLQLNFIVFCSVTSHFHIKLLKLYHEKYSHDNKLAYKSVQKTFPSTGNSKILDEAAQYLSKFHLMKSVAEGISMLELFVKTVISSLPSKNPAADENSSCSL